MIAVLTTVFLMGLLGGAHCVAMCGGVSTVLCAAAPRKLGYALAYNVGRVSGYAALGAILGGIGGVASLAQVDALRFALRAIAALCMLSVGLHLAGLPSAVKRLESLGAPLWRRVSPRVGRLLPLRSPAHALVAGVVWALMPCGLLYAALALAASAGSAGLGALTMATFGLATLPLMVTLGALSQGIARAMTRPWVRRAAGVVVLGFGVWSTAGVARQAGVAHALDASAPATPCH